MDTSKLKNLMNEKVKELQTPIIAGSEYLALNNDTLEIIRTNLKNQPLSLELFDIVKSPSGGSTVFSVPSLSGDDAEKELYGIILDYTTPRAYWSSADPVEGTPPDCMSLDSIISSDGKACAMCPYNTFGSKNGETGAKACKESVLLFLLRPNSIMPLLVRIPVTSKGRFLKYMARLIGTLTPISGVVTKISLEKATSKGGKPFALFNFEAVSTLSDEEAKQAKNFGKQFVQMVNMETVAPAINEAS